MSSNPLMLPPDAPEAPPAPRVQVRHLVAIFAWSVFFLFFFFYLRVFKLVMLGFLGALCLTVLLRVALVRLPGPRALRGFLLGLVPLGVCAGLLYLTAFLLTKPIHSEMRYWPQMETKFNSWLLHASSNLGLIHPLSVGRLWLMLGSSGFFTGFGGDAIDVAIGIIFVFIGTIYMLAEPAEEALPAVILLLPLHRQPQVRNALEALVPRLRWWLIGALIMALLIGFTSLLGFWLIGLKLFIPLAILAGISEFVPTIGPAIAFLIALAFAAAQGFDKVVYLLGLYVVVHILESYILIPLIYKRTVSVPPVVTLFTVVLWGGIFGIGGLLLAVPINLFIWTLAEAFLLPRGPLPSPTPIRTSG